MDRLNPTAAHEFVAIEAAPCDPGQERSMCCATMRVAYTPQHAAAALKPPRDTVEILIPGERGVLHAIYETTDGCIRRALVRWPDVCVIPANQKRSLTCLHPSDMVTMNLDLAYFNGRVREVLGCGREIAECHAASDPFLRGIGNVLREGFRARRAPCPAYLESLASVIAVHVAANYERGHPSAPRAGLAPHKLKRVLTLINERLAEAIRVRELASTVHMSPYHFTRMFKQATGQPPHVYITAQRMDQAKHLLGTSELSLVEVAATVGYQTQAHFTGVFHKHVGVTPRAFRLHCRDERRPS